MDVADEVPMRRLQPRKHQNMLRRMTSNAYVGKLLTAAHDSHLYRRYLLPLISKAAGAQELLHSCTIHNCADVCADCLRLLQLLAAQWLLQQVGISLGRTLDCGHLAAGAAHPHHGNCIVDCGFSFQLRTHAPPSAL